MATGNENTNRSSEDIVDSTPLLSSSNSSPRDESRRSLRRQSLREAARFLSRASNRRMMREPSMLVRETAAEQLEERQSDWAYSKPVVVLDMVWNFSFVAVAGVVLVLSRNETPSVPLRVWILGYAFQCLLHMVCVMVEFKRRVRSRGQVSLVEEGLSPGSSVGGEAGSSVGGEAGSQDVTLPQLEEEGNTYMSCILWSSFSGVAKHLESVNTMFSFIWWIIGFYWVSAGGQALATDSPQLYWFCIVFLAFDVFFVVFCVALACVIGIAVCCCLPCIIAILYAVADQQEGASKEDVEQLTKYRFRRIGDVEKLSDEIQGSSGGIMTECNTDTTMEHVLSEEDAECCICLSSYDDGVELRELPCGHHFHCSCVDKWLFINATCPLCKYNILKSSSHDHEEV